MDYSNYLNYYPGFPIAGVNFVDIIPLVRDKDVFRSLIKDLSKLVTTPNLVSPEARGFLFSTPILCNEESCVENIILMRKKGKLPYAEGDLIGVEITKEYGRDTIYFRLSDVAAGVHDDNCFHVSFFDDVLATGGTAKGIAEGLEAQKIVIDGKEYGIKVDEFVFLIELDNLNGAKGLKEIAPVKSLIHLRPE